MRYFEGGRIIKSWCNSPEPGAIAQAQNLSMLPFLHEHVALMPDTHEGYGMPIGGVIATKGVVIPNAVGVDIGCGMIAVQTSIVDLSMHDLKAILGEIRKTVPVGFNHHKEAHQDWMPKEMFKEADAPIVDREFDSACKQIGTLGGGNHFIEIQKDSLDGDIWIMIHSGSRNIGLKVANHYNNIAKKLNEKWYSIVPKAYDLAFLPLDSEEGVRYMTEMNQCLAFALANRKAMMNIIKSIFAVQTNCTFFEEINIHHNYATMEHHFNKNVMVHRKGATSAKAGELGLIPGSQGTASYVVEGRGNPESFMSCSHGAGRKMGRKFAQKNLSLEEETKKLDDQGILHSIRSVKDLDEASGAYKDIDTVMEEQQDLVNIKVKLLPLAVVKG